MIKNIKELKDVLEKKINCSESVLIVPHIGPDCDAIASAIGVSMIVKRLGKIPYIVIDDSTDKLEPAVKVFIDESIDYIRVVGHGMANMIKDSSRCLCIAVDTNKKNLMPLKNFEGFDSIMYIDHHDVGEFTLETDYGYVDTTMSSASEITFHLLGCFGIKLDRTKKYNLANYLLGGICLDTSKFTKNVTQGTMEVVAKLMKKGADMNYINELFLDDFENDMRISNLVSKTTWQLYNIAITYNIDNPEMIYTKEDLAKAADWLLKYKATDASFSLGYVDHGVVYVSARSKGTIDVGAVMSSLNGGGNQYSAATKLESNDIEGVKLTLERTLNPGYRLK